MKTIWKYTLEITAQQTIRIPEGAKILCVQTQFNKPFIWADVDPDFTKAERIFLITPTGGPVPSHSEYIGTFQIDGGQLVFHLYEAQI